MSVLNRSIQVSPGGSWVLPNVPTNAGLVRARATCVENGLTRSGQSAFFVVPVNGTVDVPDIVFDAPSPIPASLTLSAAMTTFNVIGATAQLTATGIYSDNRSTNLTNLGTTYFATNPGVATVDASGLVTATGAGTVLVSALNEGTIGMLLLNVATSGDSDNDGIPDDFELANGLDPSNPADANADPDADGLTNLREYQLGTELLDADTDNDGLLDGEEANPGADGFITNALLADTDADGIRDGLEVQTGSDPTNPASFNLAAALSRIDVTPSSATLIVNTITGQAYTQLTVTGMLIDGNTLNLLARSRGTNYLSSDLNIANFGAEDGRVFAGNEGTATVTVSNSGHSDTVAITVRIFTPFPVAAINIPGHANSVDTKGQHVYVAAGSAGLHVVDVSNPAVPVIVATRDTPGNANDVRVVGNFAYVADGSSGLQIIDITNPLAPTIAGSVSVGGTANDVAVAGSVAYVAAGSNGLVVVNVATPGAPIVAGSVRTSGSIMGVDVIGTTVIIVDTAPALRVINAANPALPTIIGSVTLSGSPNDVRVSGTLACTANFSGGMQIIGISTLTLPRVVGSLPGSAPTGFIPLDVTIAGQFALAAEVLFVNSVPIVDISAPSTPAMRAVIDFQTLGDFNGNGIAANGAYLYMTGSTSLSDRGSSGSTRLFIGQYLPLEDLAGNPPNVAITSPPDGSVQIEGDTLRIAADASDDIAVGSVAFSINGQTVLSDTSSPYEHTTTVPTGVSSLTIGAVATDLGENVRTAAPVTVSVTPDPLTTVIGRVVDANGVALSGATVLANGGATSQTASDGTFTMSGVTTIRGGIVVTASFTSATEVLSGSSAVTAAVRGGTTDVGTIVAVNAIFETNFGTFVTTCDDCAFPYTLPFSFPFYGTLRTNGFVGTNGYITFNQGDTTFSESLPAFNALPRISAFFDDLIGGQGLWVNTQLPGRFVVTYNQMRHFSFGGSNTLQIILFADGRIQFGYRGLTALSTGAITGLTPGPNSPPQQVDYSSTPSFEVPNGTAVFEYFTSLNRFDLDFGFIIFTPTPTGGYSVRTILPPPPPAIAQITNAPAGTNLVTRLTSDSNGNAYGRFAKAEVEVVSSRDRRYRAMTNTDRNGIFSLSNVPPGGIEVTVRRKGKVIGQGAAVISPDTGPAVQRIEIADPASPTEIKP